MNEQWFIPEGWNYGEVSFFQLKYFHNMWIFTVSTDVFLGRNYHKNKDINKHQILRGPGCHLYMAVSSVMLVASLWAAVILHETNWAAAYSSTFVRNRTESVSFKLSSFRISAFYTWIYFPVSNHEWKQCILTSNSKRVLSFLAAAK